MPEYSFCESIHAGPTSPWHIREVTEAGRKYGGGADTPALCGREVSWDIEGTVTEKRLVFACLACSEIYKTG